MQTRKEYIAELRAELARLIASQEEIPSKYKEDRIARLTERLSYVPKEDAE